jgi:hypothetical protein
MQLPTINSAAYVLYTHHASMHPWVNSCWKRFMVRFQDLWTGGWRVGKGTRVQTKQKETGSLLRAMRGVNLNSADSRRNRANLRRDITGIHKVTYSSKKSTFSRTMLARPHTADGCGASATPSSIPNSPTRPSSADRSINVPHESKEDTDPNVKYNNGQTILPPLCPTSPQLTKPISHTNRTMQPHFDSRVHMDAASPQKTGEDELASCSNHDELARQQAQAGLLEHVAHLEKVS